MNQVFILYFSLNALNCLRVQLGKLTLGEELSIVDGKTLLSPIALTVD